MPLDWKSYVGGSLRAKEVRKHLDTIFDLVQSGGSGASQGGIPTVPTAGNYPVTNLYVDDATGNLQVEYDDSGGAAPFIQSQPTAGNHAVTNLFVDSGTGRLTVEYNDGT